MKTSSRHFISVEYVFQSKYNMIAIFSVYNVSAYIAWRFGDPRFLSILSLILARALLTLLSTGMSFLCSAHILSWLTALKSRQTPALTSRHTTNVLRRETSCFDWSLLYSRHRLLYYTCLSSSYWYKSAQD